jgi:hypothetical protein
MFIIDEIYRDDGIQLGNDLAGGAGSSFPNHFINLKEPTLLSAPDSFTHLQDPKKSP